METAFIMSCLPLPHFRRILDVCCGSGRHARALAVAGYTVSGIERDKNIFQRACALGGGPTYLNADIRKIALGSYAFDAAIVMSQSFGWFDQDTNRKILRKIVEVLRPGGRIILDLWNPAFFSKHQGERRLDSAIGPVRETKRVEGDRLIVRLRYPTDEEEEFQWQLFTPSKMEAFVSPLALRILSACTDFDPSSSSSEVSPRLHFILGKD